MELLNCEVKTMDENLNTAENIGGNADTTNDSQNTVNDDVSTTQEPTNAEQTPTSFTQEQVNNIVRDRLARENQKFYERYNVATRDELDELIGRSRAYDEMKSQFLGLKDENSNLKRELSFLNNNINPDRKDDIMTYFKGKEMEFSDESLKQELIAHPEWLKVTPQSTTIEYMGSNVESRPVTNEKDEVAKMFGLKNFI